MFWNELINRGIKDLGGAVSGGLDSCTVTHWLSSKGFSVHCFTVDLGQPDESHLESVRNRMISCGANEATVISAQEDLADAGLKVIQSQARYEGGYWNTTGIARPVTAHAILKILISQDIEVFFHGATGRGNDQVRFQLACNMLAPNMEVYAPWRDPDFVNMFPGRQQMIEYCKVNGLPIKSSEESRYSTDANFLGLTHEAGDLEDVKLDPWFVEPVMGVWSWDAPDLFESVSIRWDEGIPTAINNERYSLVDIFTQCNKIAGKHGVGIGTHVIENRFVGTKSRGIYEAPGMELLGKTFEFLLQFILDRRAREFYDQLSSALSVQIYEGYWLDLATTSCLAALSPIIRMASGTITVRLYKGQIYFETADDTSAMMPHSLFTEDSSMESVGSYNHVDAEGLLKILGVPARTIGIRQFPNFKR